MSSPSLAQYSPPHPLSRSPGACLAWSRVRLCGLVLVSPLFSWLNAANNTLGTACGKYFRCSVMSITDQGDSDIISSLEA